MRRPVPLIWAGALRASSIVSREPPATAAALVLRNWRRPEGSCFIDNLLYGSGRVDGHVSERYDRTDATLSRASRIVKGRTRPLQSTGHLLHRHSSCTFLSAMRDARTPLAAVRRGANHDST